MKSILAILRRSRASFRGSLVSRFVVVIAMAVITGATAGILPAVIGHAVGVVSGSAASRPPAGSAALLAALMPPGATWAVVIVALVATVAAVGLGVLSSQMGTALSGEVTSALRIEMMAAVLGASARDVDQVGEDIGQKQPARPPGMDGGPGKAPPPGATPPPGKAPPPGKMPPPGATPPPGRGPAAKSAPASKHAGATRTAAVRLAVSRESGLVAEFAVSVITGLPQTISTLVVLGYELVVSDAWVVLVGGGGLFVTSRLLADRASRRVGEARRELQNADSAVFGSLNEMLGASEDLRLWGARAQAVREFTEVSHACSSARDRFAAALAVSGQIKSVFTAMAPLLILVAIQLTGRSFGASEVAKLLLLVPLLMVRLESIDALRQGLFERRPVIDIVEKLLGLAASPPRSAGAERIALEDVKGHIVFEAIQFTPPGSKTPLIDDLTLEVPAGSIVGICGHSGSGKSTLLRLLLRLDDPEKGRITIDGRDLTHIEPEQLPVLFGVVRQSAPLLARPVRDNLAIGLDPPPDDAAMRRALDDVHLDELSQKDGERGLATEVRHQPPNFSGGEQRRLLLARMLVQRAPLCVLDEPEAGLPSGTAEEILATVAEHAAGRTVLVVTHAPHLLRSDFNVVLDRGKLVARGKHPELVESCELYRSLLADALKGDAP